jgi:hypothetical protein
MSGAMMMERTATGIAGVTAAGIGTGTLGTAGGYQTGQSWLMVPRCTFKVESCQGGVKITCSCDDKVACGMVQNLCTMLAGGMCSCTATLNGMAVYTCNLTMGLCRCENTKDGVCITCTSGDTKCCEMIQACGSCLSALLKAGCTCCFFCNNTPVACGCC